MAYDDPANRPMLDDVGTTQPGRRRSERMARPQSELRQDPGQPRRAVVLRATKQLRAALGADDEAGRELLASRLFALEGYPYPKRTNPRRRLPTHEYTAYLLDAWVDSGRLVIIARGERGW